VVNRITDWKNNQNDLRKCPVSRQPHLAAV
jgi:hypothetical protein